MESAIRIAHHVRMKRIWILLACWLSVTNLSIHRSIANPLNKKICSRTKVELLDQFKEIENRIAFQNDGGLFDGGVCWWHSRLQRSSIYLATYAPEKQKPSRREVKEILRKLVHFQQVVEVPGYQNFADFTRDHADLVQDALNQWQARDGFINQQWIRGISGRHHLPAEKLASQMNRVYEAFLGSDPGLWVMIQMKGITSHALLVLDMKKTDAGYSLETIDSNAPDTTLHFEYRYGDTALNYGRWTFVPYVGFCQDQKKINRALAEHCGS